jgi:hypothetical protein
MLNNTARLCQSPETLPKGAETQTSSNPIFISVHCSIQFIVQIISFLSRANQHERFQFQIARLCPSPKTLTKSAETHTSSNPVFISVHCSIRNFISIESKSTRTMSLSNSTGTSNKRYTTSHFDISYFYHYAIICNN